MLRELQEAAQLGAKAKVHRLCVQLARNGRGVKGRRYTHVAAASPSLGESKMWLESPAEEGGMSAKILEDYDSEVRKVLSCFEPLAPAEVLQGRPDVPIRASSHHAVSRQIRGARLSRERTAAAGSSTQARQSSSDTAVARTATVAGHPSRQIGRDEMVLRAVSAWLGER